VAKPAFAPPAAAVLHIVRPLSAEEFRSLADRLAEFLLETAEAEAGLEEGRVWL
jgi:hypothetical protein